MLRYWRFLRISLGLVAAIAVIATRGSTVLSVAAAGEQHPSSLRACPAVTDRVLSVDKLSSLAESADASAMRFADYLHSIRGKDGLLPVENLGIPQVWIDHSAYQRQRHKQCAFNLYAAAMLEHALAPIARARGDHQ